MIPLKNAFFALALKQAAALVNKPARLIRLVGQLALKLKNVDFKSVNHDGVKEMFFLVGRLISAHLKGNYRIQSLRFFILLIAAIIYFLSPIDLVPDFIPGLGLVDDLTVITWVYQAAARELTAFKNWEYCRNSLQPLSA